MDATPLLTLAAEFVEHIEQTVGESAEVGTVAIVAELTAPDNDGDKATVIQFCCSDERRWVQVAFMQEGLAEAERAREEANTTLEDPDES